MTRERRREGLSGKEMSRGWFIAASLPVLVVLGVIVGYYLFRDYGMMAAAFGALAGGLLGLAWTIFEVFRWYPSKQKKK